MPATIEPFVPHEILKASKLNQIVSEVNNSITYRNEAEEFATEANESADIAASKADEAKMWATGEGAESDQSAKHYAEQTYSYMQQSSEITTNKINELNIVLSNISVPVSSWISETSAGFTAYGFNFRADITVQECSSQHVCFVNFSVADSLSGNFAPVAQTGTNKVSIWAKTKPNGSITIGSIICMKQSG